LDQITYGAFGNILSQTNAINPGKSALTGKTTKIFFTISSGSRPCNAV